MLQHIEFVKLKIARSLAEQIVRKLESDSFCNLSDLQSFLASFLSLADEAIRKPDAEFLKKKIAKSDKVKRKAGVDNGEIGVVQAYAVEIIKKLDPDDIYSLTDLKTVLEAELEKVESSMSVLVP